MNLRVLTILICLILAACNDNNTSDCITEDCDYRSDFVGTYIGTKSNSSFEDDMFLTDIEVLVELHSNNDSLLIVNGVEVPINEEGTFGPGPYEGSYFDLTFTSDSIKLLTYPIIPGLAISCYIKGDKQ